MAGSPGAHLMNGHTAYTIGMSIVLHKYIAYY